MASKAIEEKIASAPTTFGVYLFKDSRGRIIYIGKAKNLRSRLKSYSGNVDGLDRRKQKMIESAGELSYIVTDNELEALALEANLIKQNRPRYNVLLRDDKNYPYIRIDLHEEWPRIEVVRRIAKNGARYFGPYIPAGGLRETLSFIRRHFRVRPCRYASLDRVKPCVQYQIKRCPAPCGALISRDDYLRNVNEVIAFLQGKNKELLDILKKQMEDYSEKELFEEAAMVRDRLHAIEGIWDSQKVVAPGLGEVDVVGLGKKGKDAAIVQLFIRNGLMTGSKEFFLRDASDIPDDELIHAFIELLYSNQIVPAPLLLMPRKPSDDATLEQWLSSRRGRPVRIAVPERGQKRDLVKMAAKNAEFFIENYRQPDYETTVAELMKRFHLPAIPSVIGAFDISTIHGAHSIGAFICWEGGQFRKKLYRTVHIKSVSGVDDYAMMKETVQRVLRNLSEDLPDLLVIDGGKGQLESALKAIRELRPPRKPAVIAVAKEPDRAFTERGSRISLTDNRPSSLLLRQIRDEVHRFAITKHRKARTGKALSSVLDEVPGIGRKRRLALLKAFGSIDAIKKASVEDIWKLKGFNTSLARSIKDHIKK